MKENNKSSSRFAMPKLPLKRNKSKLTRSDTPESALAPMTEFQEMIGINKLDKLDKEEEKMSTPNTTQPATNLVQQAITMQKQSAEGLMSLLRIIGKAYSFLTSYESRSAIDVVESLSLNQKRSGWVLSIMAKAYFELADYKQAAK